MQTIIDRSGASRIDYTYGQLRIYKGIQLKSELIPEPDRAQHDRPAYRLIAQEYFLATCLSLRVHFCKENFDAKILLSSFLPFFLIYESVNCFI